MCRRMWLKRRVGCSWSVEGAVDGKYLQWKAVKNAEEEVGVKFHNTCEC